METLAAQPSATHEHIDRYLRTYNDTATWLAETLDGSMRTPFEFHFDGHDLIAEDGSNMRAILNDSLKDAERIAQERPSLSFELRRRQLELDEYHDILDMVRGNGTNALVVLSDFPPELMDVHEDVGGYNIMRKQTMLRVLTWDGTALKMYSQTLDQSDRKALEAVYQHFGKTPEAGELLGQRLPLTVTTEEQDHLTDRVMGIYDRSLRAQYGGSWYAGRAEAPRDTYQFVLRQNDLLNHFASRFMNQTPTEDEYYNLAALVEKRFAAPMQRGMTVLQAEVALQGFITNTLERELLHAGNEARAAGRTFSGCGVSVSKNNQTNADSQLGSLGYGNQAEEKGEDNGPDGKGPLEFKCKNGHWNRRPFGKLITQCRIHSCKNSVGC